MVVAWSGSESSGSESEGEDVANMCFLANGKGSKKKLEFSGYGKLVLKGAKGTSTQHV